MIKGVNRQIIEVNSTDSIYFEKAVFWLRPEVRELPAEVSRAEAEKYIRIFPEMRRKKKVSRKTVLFLTVAAGIILFFI